MNIRLKYLLGLYAIPLIFACIFPFIVGVQSSGETSDIAISAAFGFVLGLAFEGVMLMLTVTGAVLSGKFDNKIKEKS